ncbi:MAG TPA: hypothetical protein EYP22_00720, partial [Methanosarcinales archaeon]|nr:hypothetical protein [Methanosarcinales archaeon]
MVGLSNVFTNVKGRVDSNKDISKTKRDALVKIATENLPYDHLHIWNALWIGGPEKFINTTRLRAVVLLRRDEELFI